jgi:hypothetical protein
MVKSKFIVYVSGLCVYILAFKTVPPENSHSASDHENEQATEDNRWFGPQKCYTKLLLNYWLYGGLHHVAGRAHFPSLHYLNIHKMLQRLVPCTFLNLVCVQKPSLISNVALMVYNTPTFSSGL